MEDDESYRDPNFDTAHHLHINDAQTNCTATVGVAGRETMTMRHTLCWKLCVLHNVCTAALLHIFYVHHTVMYSIGILRRTPFAVVHCAHSA